MDGSDRREQMGWILESPNYAYAINRGSQHLFFNLSLQSKLYIMRSVVFFFNLKTKIE